MLTRWERAFLGDLFEILLPRGGHPRLPLGAADMPLVPFAERWLLEAPADVRVGFRVALRVLAWAPLLTLSGIRPLRALEPDARIAVLERLSRHRLYLLRELPLLVKTVACTGYCAHPAVREGIGLPDHVEGPPRWLEELDTGGPRTVERP